MRKTPVHLALAISLFLLSTIFLASCGGGGGSTTAVAPPPPPTLQSISVTTQTSSVAAGLTVQFTATGTYSDGSSKVLSGLSWTTSDATLATVNSNGLVTTLKQGSVTISAAQGAIKGNSTPYAIAAAAPVSLSISGNATAVLGGATPAKYTATAALTDGTSRDFTNSVTWSASDPFVATIDATGTVQTLHRGYAKISATTGNFSASADFAVTAVPRFVLLSRDSSHSLNKMTVDPSNGHLRMAGYQVATADTFSGAPCQTTAPDDQSIYVVSTIANGNAIPIGEIQSYRIDRSSGASTVVSGSATSGAVSCIEFERTGRFGFGPNGSTELSTFSRDTTTGALTLLTSTDLQGVPSQVAIDPLGKYLYVGTFTNQFASGAALGFSIDPGTGALTPITGTPFVLPNTLGDFSFHPSGKFVYMANGGAHSIDIYSIDRSTGKLTLTGSVETCINPTALQFSPTGKFAYTSCSLDISFTPDSASVETFAVAADGALSHLGTTPSSTGARLNADPSGSFFYEVGFTQVNLFAVDGSGIAKFDREFGIHLNGGFRLAVISGSAPVKYTTKAAYISSVGDNKLATHAVQPDGTLGTPAAITTQNEPFSLALFPFGTDVLVATRTAVPNMMSFPLDAAGALGLGFPFGSATTSGGIAIDPSGIWAFQTDSSDGSIYTFGKVGNAWGSLSFVDSLGNVTTKFAAGAGAGPMAVDPSGRFLFVGNQGANSISVFQYFSAPQLNEAKGNFVLPFTDGSPFALGAKPLALAVDPNEGFLYVLCNDGSIRVFEISYASGGHLQQVASTTLTGQASGIAMDATGRFLYAAGANGVSAFAIGKDGGLTSIPLTLGVAVTDVTGVYTEPSGKFLYLTASTPAPGAIFGFSINADGSLTAVSPNPVATSNQPSSMVFSADVQ